MDHLTDGAGRHFPIEATELNASEARNLAFLVSHRLARNGISLMSPNEVDESAIVKLAEDVAVRMRKLSLQFGSDEARARIASGDFA